MMQVLKLFGRDATAMSVIRRTGVGRVGGALCLGGAPKRYPFLAPNEDALLVASDENQHILAVADAHRGTAASELAIDWVGAHWAALSRACTKDTWANEVTEAFLSIDALIRLNNENTAHQSRAALILAIVETSRRLVWFCSAGDCHLLTLGPAGFGWHAGFEGNGDFFLGDLQRPNSSIAQSLNIGVVELGDATTVMLSSDGASTPGVGFPHLPSAAASVARDFEWSGKDNSDAMDYAIRLVSSICDTQRRNGAGDNVAVAVASASP